MFIENVNYIVIGTVFLLMLWLFWTDLLSYKDSNHQDFKSILVSTGVLGTFIGIFIGLWGFDSNNISDSVPKLLSGLKTAFLTSIMGMFLAVLLSIVQKKKGRDNAEDEITALNNISKQLEKLNSIDSKLTALGDVKKHIEILPLINTKLDSIDTNIKTLSSDISSVKDELQTNQQALFKFLKDKLSEIDNSLKEAVQTLSKGATEEIIKALQDVIKDFNSNLTEQFGDNFKQLNESVLNMIKWQNNYKDSIQEFEQQLKETTTNANLSNKETIKCIEDFAKTNLQQTQDITTAIGQSASKIDEITVSYTKIADISSKLEEVISTNQNQIQNLENHLRTFAEVSSEAKGITIELKTFSDEVQKSLTNQSQSLTKLTEEIEHQLPTSLDVLNKSLTSLTKQFSSDYESFLEQVSKLMKVSNIN